MRLEPDRLRDHDREDHGAVSTQGDVVSLSRATGRRAKDIRARLGEPDQLPSVRDAKARMEQDMGRAFNRMANEALAKRRSTRDRLTAKRDTLIFRQLEERRAH